MKNLKFYLAVFFLVVSGVIGSLKYLPELVSSKTILTVIDYTLYATGLIMFIYSDRLKDKNIFTKIAMMLGINLSAFLLTELAMSYF